MLGLDMIDKSKLATAKNLTKNSPVEGVESLFAWYETTSDSSILPSENNKGSSLSIWKDIKVGNIAIDAVQSNGTYKPEFSGKINGLTTTSFDGTGKNFAVDATNLNNTDYTIIVAEKRNSGSDDNYFIGDSSITSDNENILLGYSSSGQIIHSQGGANSYDSSVSAYSDSSGATRIFTFIQKKSSGKETYINGYLAGQNADTNSVNNLSNLIIGKDYNGEIGEIIIYNKALSSKERRNVEAYLGKKWAVEVSGLASSPCTNGIITGAGCEIACSVSIVGVSTPTSVGVGSGNVYCNDTGYNSDAIAYTCADGNVITGDCSGSCADGYTFYGGTCAGPCSITGIPGIIDLTTVLAGTGKTVTCNDTPNYSGSVTGTCDTTFTADSGQKCTLNCASGYYPNAENTACVQGCTGGTIDTTSVPGEVIHKFLASGTFTCPSSRNVRVLVVGAGGGGSPQGGGYWGAGGGGGGVVHQTSFAVGSSPITVTVGAGYSGAKGGNSIFSTITAYGGGSGESSSSAQVGSAGGSSTAKYAASSVTAGQGNSGGTPCTFPNNVILSGGGGAGAPGGDAFCGLGFPDNTSTAGKGGDGLPNDITGSTVYYGGGGGSLAHMQWQLTYSAGGLGGGGSGANVSGTANTGGGGGSRYSGTYVPHGGSGIVIVRY
jgi:hypothetical protein